MKKSEYLLKSFLSAVGVLIYVSAVALLMSNGQRIFGGESFVVPLFMLLLFVVSASVTGLLVLGKPVRLYFDGLKREAIILLLSTLGWLALFLIAIIIATLLLR